MIDQEQADKVRVVLASAGWNDVIRPAIEKRAQEAMKSLRLSVEERMESLPKGNTFRKSDDALREMIADCEWLASAFLNELAVHDFNRRLDELERQGQPATNSR